MHIVSDQGSERATSDPGKLLTMNGFTHVTWQDVSREGYFNRVRSYDHARNEWGPVFTLNTGVDNHARSVLAIDPEGYIHTVLGGHATDVQWRRSLKPNDVTGWTYPEPVGVGTYPIFLCGPDGSLYLAMRGQGPERWDRGVDIRRRAPGGPWSEPKRIVQLAEEYAEAYAAFHLQMDVSPSGTLHAIIDFFEGDDDFGRGIHQATCYTCSDDGGQTWARADGTPVPDRARPEDMDVLARNTQRRHEKLPPPDIRNGGLVVDSKGDPHALYFDHGVAPGYCTWVTRNGSGALRQRPVNEVWETVFPDMRAVECKLSVREDDRLCALVTLTPFNDEWLEGRPTRAMRMRERRDERQIWLVSDDGGASFEVETFLEPGSGCNVPSVEQPRGANTIPADRMPAVAYFDGSREYPGGGEYYDESRTVAETLASGGFRANNVFVDGF